MNVRRDPPLVVVYADESCLGNGREGSNPGGAAGLIEYRTPRSGTITRRDYWLSEPATTNNRMALRSVLEAFRILSAKGRAMRVIFVSDSNYIVKGVKEWLPAWIERGWKRKGGEIGNLDLWREVHTAIQPHEYDFRWVAGHAGHPQNEYANHLATRAARTQTTSNGAVESGFDVWWEIERERVRGKRIPDPFPEAGAFRAIRALPPEVTGRLS